MINERTFSALAAALVTRGYDQERAYELAGRIGDVPVVDDGWLVIMEDGRELDRIPLPPGLYE